MPDTNYADVMQAYSRDAVAYAQRHVGIVLDFSERSLEDVDRILVDYRRGEQIVPDQLSDEAREDLWVFCNIMGGYLGEVIIRNIGGQWQARHNDDGGTSVKLVTAGGAECFPPDGVWRMLTEPYKVAVSYYRGLRAVLGHGDETIVNGIRTVRLPPLSDRPPKPE